MFFENISIPNQKVSLPILEEKGIELYVKREDKTHPDVSGNKYRKLKYNLLEAQKLNKNKLITFGGAYSNHIAATAVAARTFNLKSVGIIRGDELGANLEKTLNQNSTLRYAYENGMRFEFVSRSNYREKTNPTFIADLLKKHPDSYIIPEGGTNSLAIKGCEEILQDSDSKFNVIACALGTGGTLSGIINSSLNHQQTIGFPSLKATFLLHEVKKYTPKENWHLNNDYTFGGYAKYNSALIQFINDFKKKTFIPLDPIYTGKMMFGLLDLIKNDYFVPETKILAIHTGGLQGITGFNQMLSEKKNPLKISV